MPGVYFIGGLVQKSAKVESPWENLKVHYLYLYCFGSNLGRKVLMYRRQLGWVEHSLPPNSPPQPVSRPHWICRLRALRNHPVEKKENKGSYLLIRNIQWNRNEVLQLYPHRPNPWKELLCKTPWHSQFFFKLQVVLELQWKLGLELLMWLWSAMSQDCII